MSARVLVVDDIRTNIKLLEARLNLEYFEVVTATNGADAIAICELGGCDIVLLDVMMPGMDGFEVCQRLKTTPATAHLPVVLVTALDQPADRMRGFEAGADDFLTKPIDEAALIARARSLARLKFSIDELRGRAAHSAAIVSIEPVEALAPDRTERGRILLVDGEASSVERTVAALTSHHDVILSETPDDALAKASDENADLLIVTLSSGPFDGLRLCSQARLHERTRNLPILLIAGREDRQKVLRGLELAPTITCLARLIETSFSPGCEPISARSAMPTGCVESVQQSVEMALYDPLTGLNNRRCLERRLPAMIETSRLRSQPLTLLILDIDHFKRVNDTYGHDAGDQVLKGFAARMREIVRGGDLLCRLGGEEFVVAMPGVNAVHAARIAERARHTIQNKEFTSGGAGGAVSVTVSIGLAEISGECDAAELYRRADRALYRSKAEGRNRVTSDAA